MYPVYHAPQPVKRYRFGPYSTSETEIRQLARAWFALSLAFAIIYSRGGGLPTLMLMFGVSALTVGVGFIFHELSHKVLAQKYGCWAEFRGNDQMLLMAVFMAFLGFIFAAPGAVMIAGPVDWRRNGVISAAGPSANLILAGLFFGLSLVSGGILLFIARIGYTINGWLALFNLIPILNLDGKKILNWSKPVYFSLIGFSILFVFIL